MASDAAVARRPFKLFDRARNLKKEVSARSLRDLVARGCKKLGRSGDHEVILRLEDGVEVTNKHPFDLFPDNTVFHIFFVKSRDKYKSCLSMSSSRNNPGTKDIGSESRKQESSCFKIPAVPPRTRRVEERRSGNPLHAADMKRWQEEIDSGFGRLLELTSRLNKSIKTPE